MEWLLIHEAIKREISDIFLAGNPSYTNVDEGIALFKKVIYFETKSPNLNGLGRSLPDALQDAFVDKIGDIGALRILADGIEAYLKKIYIIAGLGDEQAVKYKTLIPLLRSLNLNSALTHQSNPESYPYFAHANLQSFKNAPQYLEYICETYLTRNEVHESPNYKHIEILQIRNSLLIVYIYAAFLNDCRIHALSENKPQSTAILNKINAEDKYLYHFISYGSTTNLIRNQIVTAYILGILKENTSITVSEIRTAVNSYFNNEMDITYYYNLIQKLQAEDKIEYSKSSKVVQLKEAELKRIIAIQKNFEEDRDLFFLYFEEICKKYSLEGQMLDIFDRLREFLESNYQIDIAEATNRSAAAKLNENHTYIDFSNYLFSLTSNKDISNELFVDLVSLSKASDFLLKMSASRQFAKITNPDRFQEYMNQHDRIIYLDTQIILFALCLDYSDDVQYDNCFYQTTGDLMALAKRERGIKLKISKHYLQEAAYQLKLALMLIPFEERGGEKLSSNIFYKFYYYLKHAGLLNNSDTSFEKFMWHFFHLKESDAYDHRYIQIATSNISGIIENWEIAIEVLELTPYEKNAYDVIEDVLKGETNSVKTKHIMENDARMLTHLTGFSTHVLEPFFLTWDKQWVNYRKEHLERFNRFEAISFHLFNPAKFINHDSLLKLKINPKAITDDLLSIMDSYNTYSNTQTIWDAINRFTNIENITSEKRRRYISVVSDLLKEELRSTSDDIENIQKSQKLSDSFEDALSKINEHYYNQSEYKLDDYRNIMLYETYFKQIAELVIKYSGNEGEDDSLLGGIDALITQYRESKVVTA